MRLKWFELVFIGLAVAAVFFTAGYLTGRAGARDIEVTVEKRVMWPADTVDGIVDINTADRKSLIDLPGIGGVMADRVIEYREANGGFKCVEDLMNVPGMGKGLFEAFADRITV